MTLPPKPDDAKTPEELFTQVENYIDAVHGIIDRREFLELQGLDTFINYLCERVVAMDAEEAKLYAVQLNGLLAEMNTLGARLEESKKDVRGEIDQVNKQAAANKAYKKQDV